ncbi:LysR family transcriptional regulator [Actinoplanes sp. NPDC048796]|uniref:LysR family transcriptional regulator n=1 Tax=unclassified Actinoplanes TaxID=2626549 RepID=UPI0033BFC785
MTRHVDLNLLIALDALLNECSVTRAAERLGLSQPATSAALAKLRRHFGDELLIRAGHGYQLTPLAARLIERTGAAIAATDRVFADQPAFDPALSERTFSVIMSDYALTVLGPVVAAIVDRQAPRVRLQVRPTSRDNVDQAADVLRTTDLLVLPHGVVTDLPYHDLYEDEWVLLVAEESPARSLTMEHLSRMPWIMTYHNGTAVSIAARELRTHGVELNIRMVVESYAALPALIAGTDRVALVQRQLGRAMAAGHPVRMVACPFDATPLIEAIWWHPMNESDPGHRWLRRCFAEAAVQVQG